MLRCTQRLRNPPPKPPFPNDCKLPWRRSWRLHPPEALGARYSSQVLMVRRVVAYTLIPGPRVFSRALPIKPRARAAPSQDIQATFGSSFRHILSFFTAFYTTPNTRLQHCYQLPTPAIIFAAHACFVSRARVSQGESSSSSLRGASRPLITVSHYSVQSVSQSPHSACMQSLRSQPPPV